VGQVLVTVSIGAGRNTEQDSNARAGKYSSYELTATLNIINNKNVSRIPVDTFLQGHNSYKYWINKIKFDVCSSVHLGNICLIQVQLDVHYILYFFLDNV
jgi:hypothetical protein